MRVGGAWWVGFPPRRLRPASLGRRFVAAQVGGWPGAVAVPLARAAHRGDLEERWNRVEVIGGALAMVGLDWWIARVLFDRQSLGTAAAGIEVVTLDGRRASVLRFVVRHLGPVQVIGPVRRLLYRRRPPVWWLMAEFAAAWGIGIAVVLLRDDHRSVGDLVAGTQVVKVR